MRLARMLKLYIAAEGLEQKKVAEEIGIGESTLSRFISGAALPAADAYARVLAWCSGTTVPPADALSRIERLEAQVGNLNQRTGGLVRLGGRV
jgi:transcriptional regulator with XRE-family HTH domain